MSARRHRRTADPPTARPRTGLLNGPFLAIELRRLLRNRRTVIFTLIMPPVFFLIFGTADMYTTQSVGNGNVTAFIMVSMALYGAMLATTSGGASVSVERVAGLDPAAAAHPAAPGDLRVHQGARRDGHGPRRRRRRRGRRPGQRRDG